MAPFSPGKHAKHTVSCHRKKSQIFFKKFLKSRPKRADEPSDERAPAGFLGVIGTSLTPQLRARVA